MLNLQCDIIDNLDIRDFSNALENNTVNLLVLFYFVFLLFYIDIINIRSYRNNR